MRKAQGDQPPMQQNQENLKLKPMASIAQIVSTVRESKVSNLALMSVPFSLLEQFLLLPMCISVPFWINRNIKTHIYMIICTKKL